MEWQRAAPQQLGYDCTVRELQVDRQSFFHSVAEQGFVLQEGLHAFYSIVIVFGVLCVPRRLLPLHALSRVRYFIHACGTACGVHYVVRLACRLGVSWASDRWVQLHAAAVASGLLVCHARLSRKQTLAHPVPCCRGVTTICDVYGMQVTYVFREVVAGLFLCARIDPTKPNPPLVRFRFQYNIVFVATTSRLSTLQRMNAV